MFDKRRLNLLAGHLIKRDIKLKTKFQVYSALEPNVLYGAESRTLIAKDKNMPDNFVNEFIYLFY